MYCFVGKRKVKGRYGELLRDDSLYFWCAACGAFVEYYYIRPEKGEKIVERYFVDSILPGEAPRAGTGGEQYHLLKWLFAGMGR